MQKNTLFTKNVDFLELKDRFIQNRMLEDRAEATITTATSNLRFFFSYLASLGINDITKVNQETMSNYKIYLHNYKFRDNRSYAKATIIHRLKLITVFFKFLHRAGIVYTDPTLNMGIPQNEDKIPRVILSRQEIMKMLKSPDWRTVLGYRDRAILETLYSTGIRNIELRHIKIEDVDFDKGLLRITRGKGNRTRVVPIGEIACRFIRNYVENIKPQFLNGIDTGWLFLSSNGKMLISDSVNKMVQKYSIKCGIKKHVTPHCIRHTAATHLLEEKMDIRYIQEFLGHRKIDTTQIYTRVVIDDLQDKYREYHPRETVKIQDLPHFTNNDNKTKWFRARHEH